MNNMKCLEILKLCDMLRELDVEKNDKDTIKDVLNFIADKLEEIVGDYNGEI